jgi:hypothetical protein
MNESTDIEIDQEQEQQQQQPAKQMESENDMGMELDGNDDNKQASEKANKLLFMSRNKIKKMRKREKSVKRLKLKSGGKTKGKTIIW